MFLSMPGNLWKYCLASWPLCLLCWRKLTHYSDNLWVRTSGSNMGLMNEILLGFFCTTSCFLPEVTQLGFFVVQIRLMILGDEKQ